jgi:translation initiation factor IF-3
VLYASLYARDNAQLAIDLSRLCANSVHIHSLSQYISLGKFRSPRRFEMPKKNDLGVRINEDIDAPEIRVVDEDGAMLGLMTPQEALRIAIEREVDLVEIAPKAIPPVCKVIDFGKFRYEQQKRDKLQKKHQHQQQLKEIRFKAATDTHDFDFKTRHAREFLIEGDKVKAAVFFRGREIVHSSLGIDLLKRFVAALADVSKVDQEIRMEGNNCSVTLSPEKEKKIVPPTEKPAEKSGERLVEKKTVPNMSADMNVALSSNTRPNTAMTPT